MCDTTTNNSNGSCKTNFGTHIPKQQLLPWQGGRDAHHAKETVQEKLKFKPIWHVNEVSQIQAMP